MRIRQTSKSYQLLRGLVIGGGILIISLTAPTAGSVILRSAIAKYIQRKRFQRKRFLEDLKRLQTRKIINYVDLPDGKIKITLKNPAKIFSPKQILEFNFDKIQLKRGKWDGQWRMVLFDIPEAQKAERDTFGLKLKQIGFYALQKSAFIVPYWCEKEIEFICSILNIRNHVLMFYLKNFEGEEKLKDHFGLDL